VKLGCLGSLLWQPHPLIPRDSSHTHKASKSRRGCVCQVKFTVRRAQTYCRPQRPSPSLRVDCVCHRPRRAIGPSECRLPGDDRSIRQHDVRRIRWQVDRCHSYHQTAIPLLLSTRPHLSLSIQPDTHPQVYFLFPYYIPVSAYPSSRLSALPTLHFQPPTSTYGHQTKPVTTITNPLSG
jgi:hypothetical protein